MDGLLTVDEAADFTRLSTKTLYSYASQKKPSKRTLSKMSAVLHQPGEIGLAYSAFCSYRDYGGQKANNNIDPGIDYINSLIEQNLFFICSGNI